MALDLLGPANAANATTVRPSDTRLFGGTDTFFKPCSSPGSPDGTALQAVWLNGILQQLRRAIRGMGIAQDNADDDMLLKAIQAAGNGALLLSDALANLPIHAMVGTTGLLSATPGAGSIVVNTGQTIIHRGVKAYDLSVLSLLNRTFNTSASKTYHLRWHAPGTGEATPASSWPVGRIVLKDLADGAYNPSALGEGHASFDGTYDNVLLQRIVTDGSNALTVSNLLNLPVLASDLASSYDQSSPGQFSLAPSFGLTCAHSFSYMWGRTPKFFASEGNVAISNASGAFTMNGYANLIGSSTANRYGWVGTVTTDWLEPAPTLNNYGSSLKLRIFA